MAYWNYTCRPVPVSRGLGLTAQSISSYSWLAVNYSYLSRYASCCHFGLLEFKFLAPAPSLHLPVFARICSFIHSFSSSHSPHRWVNLTSSSRSSCSLSLRTSLLSRSHWPSLASFSASKFSFAQGFHSFLFLSLLSILQCQPTFHISHYCNGTFEFDCRKHLQSLLYVYVLDYLARSRCTLNHNGPPHNARLSKLGPAHSVMHKGTYLYRWARQFVRI